MLIKTFMFCFIFRVGLTNTSVALLFCQADKSILQLVLLTKKFLLDKQYWLTHVLFATQVDKTAMKSKANAQQAVWQKTG